MRRSTLTLCAALLRHPALDSGPSNLLIIFPVPMIKSHDGVVVKSVENLVVAMLHIR